MKPPTRGRIGTICATGWPFRVTVTCSPASARRGSSENLLFASDAETIAATNQTVASHFDSCPALLRRCWLPEAMASGTDGLSVVVTACSFVDRLGAGDHHGSRDNDCGCAAGEAYGRGDLRCDQRFVFVIPSNDRRTRRASGRVARSLRRPRTRLRSPRMAPSIRSRTGRVSRHLARRMRRLRPQSTRRRTLAVRGGWGQPIPLNRPSSPNPSRPHQPIGPQILPADSSNGACRCGPRSTRTERSTPGRSL